MHGRDGNAAVQDSLDRRRHGVGSDHTVVTERQAHDIVRVQGR